MTVNLNSIESALVKKEEEILKVRMMKHRLDYLSEAEKRLYQMIDILDKRGLWGNKGVNISVRCDDCGSLEVLYKTNSRGAMEALLKEIQDDIKMAKEKITE
jgi:hypothetical protein